MTEQSAVRYERDADGIVTLTMDDPTASANTMNEAYADRDGARRSTGSRPRRTTSPASCSPARRRPSSPAATSTMLSRRRPDDAQELFDAEQDIKADLRRLETLGEPVVAAINGAALGGGLEIALACHHRIAAEGRYEIGLPEVTLGLLPGGGGVVRTVRMLGIQTALIEVLLQGQRYKPAAAKEKGLVDELVPADQLVDARARRGSLENKDNEDAAKQPWDRQGYKMPGGTPSHPALAPMLPGLPGHPAQADSRAPTTRPRGRSCPRPSRARRSTSTARSGSRRATSPSWPPARTPRT